MQIEQCKSIATKCINGIRFFFFENGNSIMVYNNKCDFYGSYYDIHSFLSFYAKEKEGLNLTVKKQSGESYDKSSINSKSFNNRLASHFQLSGLPEMKKSDMSAQYIAGRLMSEERYEFVEKRLISAVVADTIKIMKESEIV